MPAAARAAEPTPRNPLRVKMSFSVLSCMATTLLNRNRLSPFPTSRGEIVLLCRLRLQHPLLTLPGASAEGFAQAGFSAMDALLKKRKLWAERNALRFAKCERANFADEDEDEVDGEQKKLGLDGVAIFGDGIDEVIGNGIDEQGGSKEQPPARAAGQNE